MFKIIRKKSLRQGVLATSMRVIWEARWAHIDIVLLPVFSANDLLWRSFHIEKGRQQRNSFSLLAYGAGDTGEGANWRGFAGAFICRIRHRPARLADDRRCKANAWDCNIPIGGAPWLYLVNSATEGQWLSDFIFVHHVQRYTNWIGHRQPFYYYFTTLPLDFLPWTVFAIPAAVAYFPHRQLKERPVSRFFFVCFAVIFLFFSASDTKRDLYLLPLLPSLTGW